MQVIVLEDACVDAQLICMRLDVFQGKQSTFLHDVAQVSSKCQLASLAFAQACFDEENLSANTRPSETSYDACIAVALIAVATEDGLAQQLFSLLD